MAMHSPVHPGAVLKDIMGTTTISELARHLNMPRENLSKIINGRQSVSAAVAMKLSEAFPHSSPQLWLTMQLNYDLAQLRKQKRAKIKPLPIAA